MQLKKFIVIIIIIIIIINNDLRVLDVWLRVVHNEIHKQMNLFFDVLAYESFDKPTPIQQ
jgi:hypothetical protein